MTKIIEQDDGQNFVDWEYTSAAKKSTYSRREYLGHAGMCAIPCDIELKEVWGAWKFKKTDTKRVGCYRISKDVRNFGDPKMTMLFEFNINTFRFDIGDDGYGKNKIYQKTDDKNEILYNKLDQKVYCVEWDYSLECNKAKRFYPRFHTSTVEVLDELVDRFILNKKKSNIHP